MVVLNSFQDLGWDSLRLISPKCHDVFMLLSDMFVFDSLTTKTCVETYWSCKKEKKITRNTLT